MNIAEEYFKDWFYEDMYGDRFPDKPVVEFDDTFIAFQQAMEDKIEAAYIAGYRKALSKIGQGGY